MSTTFIVRIKDQNGLRHDDLNSDVMEARSKMCDIVNGPDGMIEKWWNPMLDAVGITDKDLRMATDDIAYMAVTNAIWTMKLKERGIHNVAIESEHIILPTTFERLIGMSGIVDIRIRID